MTAIHQKNQNVSIPFESNPLNLDIVFLRGLYFQKCKEKNMTGIHLFSDTNNFKERWMYHKDEREIEVWMQYLSQQCQYYQASEIY